MQLTLAVSVLVPLSIAVISLTVLSIYYRKQLSSLQRKLRSYDQNPDQSLQVLNDLMANKQAILRVQRIDPSEMFLRSPRGL